MMKETTQTLGTIFLGVLLLTASSQLMAQDPVWELSVNAPADVYYNPASPDASGFAASVTLLEAQTSGGGTGALSDVQGYSFGVSHDPALLAVTASEVTTTSRTISQTTPRVRYRRKKLHRPV